MWLGVPVVVPLWGFRISEVEDVYEVKFQVPLGWEVGECSDRSVMHVFVIQPWRNFARLYSSLTHNLL